MIRMIISKKGYQNKKLLCYARVMVLSLLAITFVLQTPMAVTPISASTNGTYVFKPVSSLEEITQRIDEMRPIFKGYRWGNTDPNKRKTKKQLKQAVLDGYTDMSTSYSMEERRAALGLQKISGNQDVSSISLMLRNVSDLQNLCVMFYSVRR